MTNTQATPDQLAWEATVSDAITSDAIWTLDVYRAALFLLHLVVADERVAREAGLDGDAGVQLIRAAGSISANIGEGYSRTSRADRLRFFAYALGSARECVTWYWAAQGILAPDAITARLTLLTRIRALLLGLIRAHRENSRTGRTITPPDAASRLPMPPPDAGRRMM